MNKPIVTIVIPCFNEETALAESINQLSQLMKKMLSDKLISPLSTMLFVDDGSYDKTWSIIENANQKNSFVTGLKLAQNVGHQNALLAGLEVAASKSDCVISIDADLQDDISVIPQFIEKFTQGIDIVFGVREKRSTDTFFKRATANTFYWLMKKIGISLIANHADFRLMSKRAVLELLKYQETNIFLRGIVPTIGFSSFIVTYDRKKRTAGESKYPLRKMLSLGLNGLVSFSIAPIRFITFIGFFCLLISICFAGFFIIEKLMGITLAGGFPFILAICFFSGVQLLGIGIIGEYIGKIFQEAKRRPRYAIDIDLFTNKNSELTHSLKTRTNFPKQISARKR